MKKFIISFLIFIIMLTGIYLWGKAKFEDYNHANQGTISIFHGQSAKQVADLLEASGVIKEADIFYYYMKFKSLYYEKIKKEPEKFQIVFKHGDYTIEEGDFDTLIAQFNSGETNNDSDIGVKVTIPEGKTVAQMALILEESGLFSAESFVKYTNDPEVYKKLKKEFFWLPEYNSDKKNLLEGYLHANTYHFKEISDPKIVVNHMLTATHQWYKDNQRAIAENDLSFDEIITFASVVEKESKFKEDRPKVAQVFFNRINKSMKLESDITAAYANGEHKVFMYNSDIATESPFNTYHVYGLPIGPIGSPSIQSLESVLKPEGSNFKALYFYARPNGKTYYAETFSQHELNRLEFESEWKKLESEEN